jgi:hypothetical protein
LVLYARSDPVPPVTGFYRLDDVVFKIKPLANLNVSDFRDHPSGT